ncbi:hypothetical protein HDU76_004225 [Blyttiomyces sp. JEL0837]|nr:hypothetical protein HDU76_004225 [Blyttiomyces sp. JEL0837]
MGSNKDFTLTFYYFDACYSSWSIRIMLLLDHFKIQHTSHYFLDIQNESEREQQRKLISPSGLFPCMHIKYNTDNTTVKVSDTLAIMETLADLFPSLAIWPKDFAQRAKARSISAEMHAGFMPMRNDLSCNLLYRVPTPKTFSEDVLKNIKRVCEIWEEQRGKVKGTSGDQGWLFGEFSAADAMYIIVATRFRTHHYEIDAKEFPLAREYYEMVLKHPLLQKARVLAQESLAKHNFHRYDSLFVGYERDNL